MLRRNARLRREYLYVKSLEKNEREKYQKKKKLQKALDEGVLPTELRDSEPGLRKDMELDDARTEIPQAMVDDEYSNAGILDPKIYLTTSRHPSSRLAQFSKELRLVFPGAVRVNRGRSKIKEIVDFCRAKEVTDLIIVHEHQGVPDGLIVSHMPYGPTAYFGIMNCVLRHDVADKKTASEAFPHLIFHQFDSDLGGRVQNILKYLFPVPKTSSKRVITFANRNDLISFRHHMYKKTEGNQIELEEVGPRFELKLYQIKLGTIDMREAQNEWVLRPYMSTAKTRQYLSSAQPS